MPLREGSTPPAAAALDDAIWRTIAYAGLFQYPLRVAELQRRLMDVAADGDEIAARLRAPGLRGRVVRRAGFLAPRGGQGWIDVRRTRARHTARLLADHAGALRLIARVPFVRLAAVSGACAHGNAADDDVDLLIVTRAGRAWTVALLLMIASKLAGLRRSLCVNYVLAEDGLALPERDRFTASEIVALRPLAGRETYRRLIAENGWVAALHPNFVAGHVAESEHVPRDAGMSRLERLLDVMGASVLESAARACLEPYLRARLRGPGVVLSAQRLKLHTRDHRAPVSEAFEQLLDAEDETRPHGREARTA